jgi:hypothetical protein
MPRPPPAPTAAQVVSFLDDLRVLHAPILPIFGERKVLTFMGTTSWPGRAPAMAVRRVAALTASPDRVLRLTIEGPLPRPVEPGERVAVSLTDSARFFGFQLKTPVLTDADRLDRLVRDADGRTELVGSQVFTVHPTEYTTRFFEDVPVADVVALADQLRFALVAVGAQANVSPRFVFHHELDGATISLFHGDSALNKTHLNLQSNDREARLIVDLGRLSGLILEGTVAPFTAEEHPVAAAAVTSAFTAAGLGAPRRLYRLRAERWSWADAGPPRP